MRLNYCKVMNIEIIEEVSESEKEESDEEEETTEVLLNVSCMSFFYDRAPPSRLGRGSRRQTRPMLTVRARSCRRTGRRLGTIKLRRQG